MQQLFVNASALAQQKLVNVLEDKTGNGISTGDGVVTLDLSELVKEIGTELGLSAAALAKLPPDAGVITVMRSDQFSAAQTAVQSVRVLSTRPARARARRCTRSRSTWRAVSAGRRCATSAGPSCSSVSPSSSCAGWPATKRSRR